MPTSFTSLMKNVGAGYPTHLCPLLVLHPLRTSLSSRTNGLAPSPRLAASGLSAAASMVGRFPVERASRRLSWYSQYLP
jgi:hypothetical protein